MSKTLIVLLVIFVLGFILYKNYGDFKDTSKRIDVPTASTSTISQEVPAISIVATGLEVPWALAFLPASPAGGPDNSILVTERKGTVRLVKDGKLEINPVAKISVKQTGESGLHGIAIDPKFSENNFVYLYYTYSGDGDQTLNRVSRYNFENQILTDEKIIVDKIPGAIFHDGGRIKFGPDGYLYITTGDARDPSLAQDKKSLAGKILRVVNDKVEIYSYGHRNPQGIAWDNNGLLFATEHGNSANDEVNLIIQNINYGWPVIQGSEIRSGMNPPATHSGSNTWAPAGAAIYNNTLYFGGLRGTALYSLDIKADYTLSVKEERKVQEHLKGQFGRIRDVVLGPDNMLYITTSNRDGRGTPTLDDDKIIRINPNLL